MRFQNLSIGRKLQLINLLVTGIAGTFLVLFLSALMYISLESSYQKKVEAISALLSDNVSPALLFRDNKAAKETLETLRTVPDVAYAEVFDREGNTFARYGTPGEGVRPGGEFDPARYPPGINLGSSIFNQVVPVRGQDNQHERIGTVVVQMNLQAAYRQMAFDVGVLLMLALLAFVINSRLLNLFQRGITKPLFDLTRVMNKVSKEGDFTLRAESSGADEIGTLARTFNQMLNELSRRENSLQQQLKERKRVDHQLISSNIRFETVLKALPDLMFEVDAQGVYLNIWGSRTDLLAAPRAELLGKSVAEMLPPEAAGKIMISIEEANQKGYSHGLEISLLLPQGVRWFELSVAKQEMDIDEKARFVVLSRDITERKQSEEQIQHLAFYDPLTGLPNRRLLLDRLKRAVATSARNARDGALLFIDMDNFKTLNDTLGHDMGDLLLQQVAKRITGCLRKCDTVARLGGDEFVVILEELSDKPIEAASTTESVGTKILKALAEPFDLAIHTYSGSTSIGATLFSKHQYEIDELLKQADIAMYQAKDAGRNTLRFFDQKMQDIINQRAAMESELRQALAGDELRLHYQIQVNDAGRPVGAETLIRWIHPARGLVNPAEFIPLAEDTGLIVPIGQWVVEQACSQLKKWQQDARTRGLVLSVNVSAKQFHQPDFVAHVQAALSSRQIDPGLLKLELTESMLLKNVEEVIVTMKALKAIGVRFSLDDFGTGYSSLQYLKQLPLDQLKIDQSFVRDVAFNQSDKAIVRTIIAMAEGLNLEVIAEGVETEAQRQILQQNGCNHYQGYLFGQPLPIEQFEELLNKATLA